jgi:hypothetical protein
VDGAEDGEALLPLGPVLVGGAEARIGPAVGPRRIRDAAPQTMNAQAPIRVSIPGGYRPDGVKEPVVES